MRLLRKSVPRSSTLRERAEALRATASRLIHRRRAPDPIFATIAASRAAEEAMAAFQKQYIARPMTSEAFAREDMLAKAQNETRDAVRNTRPTTTAGCRALVEYARYQANLYGTVEQYLFDEMLGAFERALGVRGRPHQLTTAVADDADLLIGEPALNGPEA